MTSEVTEKTFYKQLAGSSAGAIVSVCIGGAVVGFCAVFCGTQLGWKNILTVVFLSALVLCAFLLIFFIVKAARMKQHRVFKRYGSAAMLAAKINEGLKDPRYFAKGFFDNAPFVTLLTDTFIVSGLELVSYMELKDLQKVHAGAFATRHTVVVGDPLLTAGSIAANCIGDRYLESKGINSQTQFDMLIFEDASGKEHRYSVHHQDMEAVIDTLEQIAPHIRFVP